MDNEQIIDSVICAWHKSGLSQAQLAQKSGIPLSTLNSYLTGNVKRPSADIVDSILATASAETDLTRIEDTAKSSDCVQAKEILDQLKSLEATMQSFAAETRAEHEQLMDIGYRMIRKESREKIVLFTGFILVLVLIIAQFHG